MGRIVTAYQPHYYPRLHYLARAQQADVFVIYDDVQFSRGSPQNRAAIEYQGMESLVAPVQHTGRDSPIDEAALDMSNPWPATHAETLIGKYGAVAKELVPFYERLCARILDIDFLRENPETVADLAGGSHGRELVDRYEQRDAEWRTRKREMDELRHEKKNIEGRIAERKCEDPNAGIEDLVSEVNGFAEQLEAAEADAQETKEARNQVLMALSEQLSENDPVQWLQLHELWMVTGIDPEELMGDTKLIELTIPILNELLKRFDVTSTVVRSSELDIEHPGDASEYLARMTEAFDGDGYLSGGVGYENYLDEEPFEERGIEVLVQDWEPTWEDGNVCALDVLFGADDPGQYIR